MLDQLLNLIQQQGQQAVVNNPAVPNEYNNEVLGEAGNSIMSGLQQALAGGGLSQVMNMFSQGGSSGGGIGSLLNNPMVQGIISQFTGSLTNRFNVDPSQAAGISQSLIPQVLSSFAGKVADPNDSSIDINGVMQSLTGGNTSGIDFQGLLSKFQGAGGDFDGDGDVDLQDIIARVSGGASQSGGAGGLMDMIKGFMK
ncbi:MAG TPA: hypothetical protein VFX73_03595 [Chitinophagaceae bacterium]|jgi:hypothetical protein|nr:hypothetical protein [Chitinophagaceae bacterium]